MSTSPRLALPLLAAAQAQKHVTHNEALLRLDGLLHAGILGTRADPPGSPQEGDGYLIGDNAGGEWSGRNSQFALFRDGVWHYADPFDGFAVFDRTTGGWLIFSNGAWQAADGIVSADRLLAEAPFGAQSWHKVIETELAGLSGAAVSTAPLIPDRAIVYCVSTRTVSAVTGAVSYDCGLSGEPSKFGGSLGIAAGSSNLGVIGPTAFYSPAAVQLSANGGAFTGGTVRLAVHCFVPVAPSPD
ncbi:DUF2793 domain-containing protein [Roseibium sp. RKSG952]|uniref:DUF2793 domain-containing protein n=1 Tax=Roseibium sp. RKSG952 TaxID=2529384 RepID=UPI0012BB6203|nr:DUF2793 domain-containing protein [Roseibium sp. RKSG952]MTH96077.1 DUF2793 domain-containing protein [Roseibium sp. RKSG952]